jgi:hypothetical protein
VPVPAYIHQHSTFSFMSVHEQYKAGAIASRSTSNWLLLARAVWGWNNRRIRVGGSSPSPLQWRYVLLHPCICNLHSVQAKRRHVRVDDGPTVCTMSQWLTWLYVEIKIHERERERLTTQAWRVNPMEGLDPGSSRERSVQFFLYDMRGRMIWYEVVTQRIKSYLEESDGYID